VKSANPEDIKLLLLSIVCCALNGSEFAFTNGSGVGEGVGGAGAALNGPVGP